MVPAQKYVAFANKHNKCSKTFKFPTLLNISRDIIANIISGSKARAVRVKNYIGLKRGHEQKIQICSCLHASEADVERLLVACPGLRDAQMQHLRGAGLHLRRPQIFSVGYGSPNTGLLLNFYAKRV